MGTKQIGDFLYVYSAPNWLLKHLDNHDSEYYV